MNDLVTLEAIAAEAHKADQMGRQTVAQLAKVGQMIAEYHGRNPTKESLSRVITATGYQQAHVYRLMTLAKHWPQIEQKHPESLRGALLLIEQSKPRAEPPRAVPEPPRAVPVPDASFADVAFAAMLTAMEKLAMAQRDDLKAAIELGKSIWEILNPIEDDGMTAEEYAAKSGKTVEDIEFYMRLAERFEFVLWKRKAD